MTPTKESVKKWLKEIGKSREWLASECETEKGTINNWLSPSGPFPASAILKIHDLMKKFPSFQNHILSEKKELLSFPNAEGLDRITIEVDGDLQININKKALALGMTTSCWASLALEEAAGEPDIMERIERLYAKKNAAFSSREVPEETPPLFCFTKKKAARFIEVVGNIAAGNLQAGDSIPYRMMIDKKYPIGSYALRVSGSSMSPEIPDGSVVVVKPWKSTDLPKMGTLVVYHDDRGVTLKRLSQKEGQYVLEALNRDFADIRPIDGDSISAVHVDTIGGEDAPQSIRLSTELANQIIDDAVEGAIADNKPVFKTPEKREEKGVHLREDARRNIGEFRE